MPLKQEIKLDWHYLAICRCLAGVVLGALSPRDVLNTSVQYSLSRVWHVGNAVMQARIQHQSPIQAVIQCQNGKLLCVGEVSENPVKRFKI